MENPAALRNVRLLIEYDGSAFSGWQQQRGASAYRAARLMAQACSWKAPERMPAHGNFSPETVGGAG